MVHILRNDICPLSESIDSYICSIEPKFLNETTIIWWLALKNYHFDIALKAEQLSYDLLSIAISPKNNTKKNIVKNAKTPIFINFSKT